MRSRCAKNVPTDMNANAHHIWALPAYRSAGMRLGEALLLARAPDAALPEAGAGGGPLQAWLVSFVPPNAPVPAH